jgi:hypothetical protein
MLHRFLAAALLLATALLPVQSFATTRHHQAAATSAAASDGSMQQFDTEASAQSHCPSDTVVWLNTKTGIWHEKGMRWYGNTKQGAYVCRKEAAGAGDRDTKNGQ